MSDPPDPAVPFPPTACPFCGSAQIVTVHYRRRCQRISTGTAPGVTKCGILAG
jgi:hypothetical protein